MIVFQVSNFISCSQITHLLFSVKNLTCNCDIFTGIILLTTNFANLSYFVLIVKSPFLLEHV